MGNKKKLKKSKKLNKNSIVLLLICFILGISIFTIRFTDKTLKTDTKAFTESKPFLYGGSNSPFAQKIPESAVYTVEPLIGVVRQVYEDYSMPIYRIPKGTQLPLVKITNTYSGRVVNWPIPANAIPASGSDMHLGVLDYNNNTSYEMWNAVWANSSSMRAGGMKDFPFYGNGISNPINHRVTASGFAVSAGMIIKEDFFDPQTNTYNINKPINHALAMAIPHQILKRGEYIPPAVGGDVSGDNTGEIPLGTRYALPRGLPIESMSLHPLTKAIAVALRDYGVYVNDRNASQMYQNTYVGTIRVEPAMVKELFGKTNDELIPTVAQEMHNIIKQYKLYKITGVNYDFVFSQHSPTPTSNHSPRPTSTLQPTMTPRPTASPRPSVTLRPSSTPSVTPNNSPRPTSTLQPTMTPRPTASPRPSVTLRPSSTPSVTPNNSPRPTSTLQPTNNPTPTQVPLFSNPPDWWLLIPSPLRNYLEQLWLWIFFFRQPSTQQHLLEGLPTPTP